MNNTTNFHDNDSTHGWTASPNGRGTWEILTSCVLTIFLCCWTSVCSNIPAKSDGRWARFKDKLDLACIGLLGPEFLLMLAAGQWTSARQSVKKFHDAGYKDWTMAHAFFADMGGFLLQPPDSPEFPLDAEQLHYLVTKKYIAYPALDKEEIDDKNKADGLARFITICQVIWFTISCVARPIQGLFLTTFELTTLSFIVVFFTISFCWLHKPSNVTRALPLPTTTKISTILSDAGHDPHTPYYRTPLTFLSRREWFCSLIWTYDTMLLRRLHIPLFSRPVPTRPWNRNPSDSFPPTDALAETIASPVIIAFSIPFLLSWNESFPSEAEVWMWRAASVFGVLFAVGGGCGAGFCDKVVLRAEREKVRLADSVHSGRLGEREGSARSSVSSSALGRDLELQARSDSQAGNTKNSREENGNGNAIHVQEGTQGRQKRTAWFSPSRWRNISPDQDPALTVPLRVLIPIQCLCAMYCVCRLYILVEDIIGLRRLPGSAFETVEWANWVVHF